MAEYAAARSRDGMKEQLLTEAKRLRKHSLAIRGLIAERQAPALD